MEPGTANQPRDGARVEVVPVEPSLATAVDDAVIDLTAVEPHRAGHVLGRDPSDFSFFYLRYRVVLTRRASRFLADPRDVDEVVQETFLRVFLALDELETEMAAVRFAQRVLVNMCIDRYRSQARRPGLLDLDAFVDELIDAESDDPVLRAEDAAIVREALSRLTPEHRTALVKREIEEKSLPVIAAEMDVPVDQVKHLLYRARRALRRILIGTSVDPGADLTAGIPRQRRVVAAAARVTAVVVLLVAGLGWAVGVRPWSGSAGHPAPVVGAQGQVSIPVTVVPRQHPRVHHGGSPDTKPTASHSQPAPDAPAASRPGRTAGTQHAANHPVSRQSAPTHHHRVTSPPATQPPPPARTGTTSSSGSYAVSGLLHSASGQVTDQSRVVTGPQQYQSTSTFVAQTNQGAFSMQQQLTFATSGPGVQATGASLSPLVPSKSTGETYGYFAAAPNVSVQPVDSGYVVTVSGVAQPWSEPAADAITVTVTASYTDNLTGITSEQVTLTPAPDASPSASPNSTTAGSNGMALSGYIRRPNGPSRDESSVS